MKKKILSGLLDGFLSWGVADFPVADAHGIWFANRLDQVQLVLGEGFKDNAYDPKMVIDLQGYDADYRSVHIEAIDGNNHIAIAPDNNVSVAVVKFDYGYWSKGQDGKWHNAPMNEVSGATIGSHAIKYSVNYFKPVDKIKAIADLPYQIVPLKDPVKLAVGEDLPVQVLKDGKGMAGAEIIPDVVNHHTVVIHADGNGVATVKAANGGINVIGMEITVPHKADDGKASQDKIFTSLSFTLYPQEED